MFLNWVNPSLKNKFCIIKCLCGGVAIILGLGYNSPTIAQTTSNVIVDLSMLSEVGGDFRGDRADRGDRGEFRGRGDRGEFRGRGRGRGDRGDRGEYRGRGRGRGSEGPAVAVNDETAFPSLGAK